MYARLSKNNFDYSTSNQYSQYSKLRDSPSSGLFLDNQKFILSQDSEHDAKHSIKTKLETQFFDSMRVPEQAQVVQPAISRTGR